MAAAGLIALSFLAGFALVLYAADLPTQIGSVYRHELPGGAISLIGGGLLPILLLLLVMDLETRRRQRRRQWRQRRRGEPAASTYGDSMLPGTDSQPSRYPSRSHAAPGQVSAPAPLATSAPAPLAAPAPTPLAASAASPTPSAPDAEQAPVP
ncbi:MAG: hypothetical protein U1F49_01655 [Rubrivivax sp.]